jgi:hypothetical protein
MKKQMKKLTLAKETVRILEKQDGLRYVAGGAITGTEVQSKCNFCDYDSESSCPC